MRISSGTPGQVVGTAKPNTGSRTVFDCANSSLWIAEIMARVSLSFMRAPTPYAPPDQPVFTNHALALYCCIFAASSSAYLEGRQTRNGPPKHGENVACGSVTPISVPATFAV